MLYNNVNRIALRITVFTGVWGDTMEFLLSPGVVLRLTLILDGRAILSWILNKQGVLRIRRVLSHGLVVGSYEPSKPMKGRELLQRLRDQQFVKGSAPGLVLWSAPNITLIKLHGLSPRANYND
jgi:hypothetical protein